MKILLVNPPRSPHNAILDYAPPEALRFVHRKLIGPPLGLLTVAAAVAHNHDIELFDMKGEYDLRSRSPEPSEMLTTILERFNPDLIGITFIASEFPAGIALLKKAKAVLPRIITAAGGLHPTLCPHDFDIPEIDIVFRGPSAHTFADVVALLEQHKELDSIPGVLTRKGGHLTAGSITEEADSRARRDAALIPDRSLLKPWLSTYRVKSAPGPVTYLFTSLGCPHRCTFCSIWPQFAGAFYQRDSASIIHELKMISDYPVVRFADANTVVDTDFISDLFDKIAAEEICKEYVMDIRADTAVAAPWLIEKMARSGLKVVITGFESFRDTELGKYNKNSPANLIDEAIRVFHDNGIKVRGNYVIPPDYEERDFAELASFANNHRVSFAGYTILTPMPGTTYYDSVKSTIVDHDLAKYNFFNCVLPTRLPLIDFYKSVGALWSIKEGFETI